MNKGSLSRRDISRILARQTPEQILDSQEEESRSLLELSPQYGRRYLRESFRRKNPPKSQDGGNPGAPGDSRP